VPENQAAQLTTPELPSIFEPPKKPTVFAPPPASDDADTLAKLAEDTLRGFEQRFVGRISWTLGDMSGLVGAVENARAEEEVILKLLVAAFEARVHDFYTERVQARTEASMIKRETAGAEFGSSFIKNVEKDLPKFVADLQDALEGKKKVRSDDEQAAKESQALQRRLGISYVPIPDEPPVDDTSSAPSGAGGSSTGGDAVDPGSSTADPSS
jgi:hypothetical protein